METSRGLIPGGWTQAEIDAVEKVKARRRLKGLDLDRVDLVGEPANKGARVLLMKAATAVPIRKVDRERRRVYGYASISTVKGQEVVDAHGDVIGPEDLEEAAATFRGTAGVDHAGDPVGEIFESVFVDQQKAEAMGLTGADGMAAWWIGVQLPEGRAWEAVKSGALPAFSIQGRAVAEPVGKSSSHQRPAASPVLAGGIGPNPERERFLKERAAAIRRDGGRPFVPETATERQRREVELAKQKLAKLSQTLKELS